MLFGILLANEEVEKKQEDGPGKIDNWTATEEEEGWGLFPSLFSLQLRWVSVVVVVVGPEKEKWLSVGFRLFKRRSIAETILAHIDWTLEQHVKRPLNKHKIDVLVRLFVFVFIVVLVLVLESRRFNRQSYKRCIL